MSSTMQAIAHNISAVSNDGINNNAKEKPPIHVIEEMIDKLLS